ncbi:MAG: lysine--tRNA ligase [Bradymonadales bacterium]|nr:lysine--tRNA ligase [Bradymonadales bacterium]
MNNNEPQCSEYVPESRLIAQRLGKADSLRDRGINPFTNQVRVDHTLADLFRLHGEKSHTELQSQAIEVSVAGRLRFFRRMGKASFLKVQDGSCQPGIKPAGQTADGRKVPPTDDLLQLLVQSDMVGAEAYELCQSFDLGDYIAASGLLMRTRTGELTVQVRRLKLLTKSLRPLPEKWHGLSDMETRFRQRYVDLIMNDRAKETLRIRFEATRLIRQFFYQRGFVEVETPMLHTTPGGAAARPFLTHHNALDLDLYLRIAPELYLKRLVVGGFERLFEIGRCFRNEGLSRFHNPEFTMVEFYQAFATFLDLMTFTEELLTYLVGEIHHGMVLTCDSHQIDFTPPWPRLTVHQAVAKYTGVDEDRLHDRGELERLAAGCALPDHDSMNTGKLLMALFDALAQPHLVQPTFVTHYPLEVSPLSRKNEADPTLVDRFELFVAGWEVANAFSELNDPVDQYMRFLDQLKAKAAGDEEAHPMDLDYIRALEYAMPPAAGEGIGLDRLAMILADAATIREVIPFPLLRPESGPTTTVE